MLITTIDATQYTLVRLRKGGKAWMANATPAAQLRAKRPRSDVDDEETEGGAKRVALLDAPKTQIRK